MLVNQHFLKTRIFGLFGTIHMKEEHGRRDSNPQQAVLETAALPIELLPYLILPHEL